MKPTQKNKKKTAAKNEWQIPERTQVITTPGAEKSIENAARKGEEVRFVSDRRQRKKLPKKAQPTQKSRPERKRKEPASLKEAIIDELRDRAQLLRLKIQLNSEDLIRSAICAGLLCLFALLQTTFFARFSPFGAVPDLMLIFVIAIGTYEGEKWGCVVGLISAFVIQSIGSAGTEPSFLTLVYMPAGCAAGLFVKHYLSNTFPVKLVFIGAGAFIKLISTIVTASMILDASFGDILLSIAIPEYFSTVLLSSLPYVTVWICFRHFHKTRAERTDSEIL